jgi:hypothetical protein
VHIQSIKSNQALLAIRVPGESLEKHQFRDIFEGKQRTIELQVQGTFKRPPRGEIFVGGEITVREKEYDVFWV